MHCVCASLGIETMHAIIRYYTDRVNRRTIVNYRELDDTDGFLLEDEEEEDDDDLETRVGKKRARSDNATLDESTRKKKQKLTQEVV